MLVLKPPALEVRDLVDRIQSMQLNLESKQTSWIGQKIVKHQIGSVQTAFSFGPFPIDADDGIIACVRQDARKQITGSPKQNRKQ